MKADPSPRPSIERRLRRLVLAGVGGVILVAWLALDYVVVQRVSGEFDRALLAKARALVTLTKQQGGDVELDFADEFMPEFEAATDPEYFQLWLDDGRLLERSHSLKSADLPRLAPTEPGERFFDSVLPDGRAGRAVEVVFTAQRDDKEKSSPGAPLLQRQVVLVVARERGSLERLLWTLHLSLLAAIGVVIAVVAGVVRLAVKKGLASLHEVGSQLRRLDAERLDSRLDLGLSPRELQPLIEQFNALLGRLERSFLREQRFSADVAHELRTPVSELRNLAEVAMRWPEDQRLLAGFFQDVLNASLRMQRTINNLLALARCEKGGLELDYREAELRELVDAAWSRIARQAQLKELHFRWHGAAGFRCYTSPHELELILDNLFSNAVAYSPRAAEIRASIVVDDGRARFILSNPAEHLAHADLALMFDRLWRKDPARAGDSHAGLGLSLVQAYARLLALEVSTELTDDGRFSIAIGGWRRGLPGAAETAA